MKRTEMIRLLIDDAAHGQLAPLAGFIDWLVVDHKVSLIRIIKLGEKHFSIPRETLVATLEYLA